MFCIVTFTQRHHFDEVFSSLVMTLGNECERGHKQNIWQPPCFRKTWLNEYM